MTSDILYLLLYIIIVVLILKKYHSKNNRQIGHITILLLLYLAMGIASIVGYVLNITRPVIDISFLAMGYLLFCLIIIFSAFSTYKDKNFQKISIGNSIILFVFERFLVIGGVFSLVFYSPFAIKAIFTENLQYNRNEHIFQETLRSYGIFNSIAALFSEFFIIMLVLAFINFSIGKKKNVRLGIMLFFSSFSYIVKSFSFGGRDGVVYWGISFMFVYYLLRLFLSNDQRKIIIKSGLVLLGFLLIPFMIITVSRFSVYSTPIYYSLIDYLGMQITNFSDLFIISPPLRYGGANIPVIMKFLENIGFNINVIYDRTLLYGFYEQFGAVSWVFSTFLGGLLSDFGKIGTLVIVFIFSFRTNQILRKVNRTKCFPIFVLFEYVLIYQYISWGLFYNRLYAANKYMIALLFVVIIFWTFKDSSYTYILVKKTGLKNE